MSLSTAILQHAEQFHSEQNVLYSLFQDEGREILKSALDGLDELPGLKKGTPGQTRYIVDDGEQAYLLVSVDGTVKRLAPGFKLDEENIAINDDAAIPSTIVTKPNGLTVVRFIAANEEYDFPLVSGEGNAFMIDKRYLESTDDIWGVYVEQTGAELFDKLSRYYRNAKLTRESFSAEIEALLAKRLLNIYFAMQWSEIEQEVGDLDEAYPLVLQELFAVRDQFMQRVLEKLEERLDALQAEDEDEWADLVGLNINGFVELSLEVKTERSPLWAATLLQDPGEALNLAQSTIDRWQDVNETANLNGMEGLTPLAMASGQQSPAFLKLLIDNGADVNSQDTAGFVPLSYALQEERLDNFCVLLDAGANPDPLPSGSGRYSPLSMAADHGLTVAVKELLARGADVNWVADHGGDALKHAAANGHLACVNLLLEEGATAASFDNEGFSPIHNAVDNTHHDVVMRLLDAGVPIDLPVGPECEEAGRTPLHRACANIDFELVRKLVERGAVVNSVAEDESTPLSSALIGGLRLSEDVSELIEYLLQHGAVPTLINLMMALSESSVATFKALFNYFLPKMDKPLMLDSKPMDRDGISDLFLRILAQLKDAKRVQEIKRFLKESGFELALHKPKLP